MAGSEFDRELRQLETDLRRLEAEYNMYFSGRLPRPPWETRSRVTALFKRYDRGQILNTGERFRFQTLQSRFATFVDLWDRALKAREEGRPGIGSRRTAAPSSPAPPPSTPPTSPTGVLHVAAIRDPAAEPDKLRALHQSLVEAREGLGEPAVPFERFEELVKKQVRKLQGEGGDEVAFRVAVKDGKVTFTARAVKRDDGES